MIKMILHKQQLDFVADMLGRSVSWPSHLHVFADELEQTNPRFNRDKFIQRATKAWENQYHAGEIDDDIPY